MSAYEYTLVYEEVNRNYVDRVDVCKPGSFSSNGMQPCTPCPVGQYQTDFAQTQCDVCPGSETTFYAGSMSAEACMSKCQAGSFSICGYEPCEECEAGFYQPNSGEMTCIQCPVDQTTASSGSSSSSDCKNFEESVSCFGETATPSCSAGFTMDFAYVNYGRTDGSTCPHVAMSDQDCTSTPVIINDNCQGQETCSVAVTTSNMGGDPCGGTFKYLHLKWLCVSNGA
ncbi:hypothetical protein ScPMuIL_016537 [Solemya velum]